MVTNDGNNGDTGHVLIMVLILLPLVMLVNDDDNGVDGVTSGTTIGDIQIYLFFNLYINFSYMILLF